MRLTREEMTLIAGLCLALVAGALVKHYRDGVRAAGIEPAKEAPGKAGIVSSAKNP